MKKQGGLFHDEVLDLTQDNNDRLISTGYYNSIATFGSFSQSSNGYSDVFVHKMLPGGTTMWALAFGGEGQDRGTAITHDALGNVYICGYFTDLVTIGTTTLDASNPLTLEGFVAKISPTGAVLWAMSFGGTDDEFPYDIATDAAGNVIVTGQFRGTATFGGNTFTSADDPDTSDPAMDIFLFKLNSSGVMQWVRTGTSPYDDRGMALDTDANNHIYLTGQFSGDLMLDTLHPNEIANCGFVASFNELGEEIWFLRFSGSYTQPNGLKLSADGNVYLTGDVQGDLAVYTTPLTFESTDYDNNLFLMSITSAGSLNWISTDGSNNSLSCRALAIADNNDIYLTGNFECVLDEYSEAWGEGLFNSAGFSDIFIAAYHPTGERSWERHIGGPQNNNAWTIAEGAYADRPVVAGAFESFLAIQATDALLLSSDLWFDNPMFPPNYYAPNNPYDSCASTQSGAYAVMKSSGARDAFVASPVDLSAPPLELYTQYGGLPDCTYPIQEPCISDQPIFPEACQDSLWLCGYASIYWNSFTGTQNYVGPEYDLLWSSGSTTETMVPLFDGWYWITATRLDGCASFTDSVYVDTNPNPVIDLFSDCPPGYQFDPVNPVLVSCGTQVNITLDVTPSDPEDYAINWSTGDSLSTITINEEGDYYVEAVDDIGCYDFFPFTIAFENPFLPGVDYDINYLGENVEEDTINLCQWSQLNLNALNWLGGEEWTDFLYADITIIFDGLPFLILDSIPANTQFTPTESGLYEFEFNAFMPCCSGPVYYPQVSSWVYVNIIDAPDNIPMIDGPDMLCSGETAILTVEDVEDNSTVNWIYESEYIAYQTNSIEVLNSGYYVAEINMLIDSLCYFQTSSIYLLQSFPAPVVTALPENAIVCPGDSVQLIVEAGLDYLWIGPLGQALDTTQSIYVTTPGFYYAIQTNEDTCTLESNAIEVSEYNTPYLFAALGDDLCLYGYVTVEVETNEWAAIEWQPPLSGSDTLMSLTTPGLYQVMVSFCEEETWLEIEVYDTFVPSEITCADSVLCPGDTLWLYANAGMEGYAWDPVTGDTDSLLVVAPGTYTLTTTDSLGCIGLSDPFWVMGPDDISPETDNATICIGQSALLEASSPLPLYWSADPEGLDTISYGATFMTPPLDSSSSYYVGLVTPECGVLPQLTEVFINSNSTQPTISADSAYCTSDNVSLEGEGLGNAYLWTLPDGTQVYNAELNLDITDPTYTGWYILQYDDGNCISATDSAYIIFIDPVQLTIGVMPDTALCEGEAFMLTADVPAPEFYWTTPEGTLLQTDSLQLIATESAEGFYSFIVDGSVCENEIVPVYIAVYPQPVPDILIEGAEGCAPLTANFSASSEAETTVSYQWDFGDGSSSGEAMTTHTYPDPGWYDVTLTASTTAGCVGSISVTDTAAIYAYPWPEAAFETSPLNIGLFDNVSITDLSTGGVSCYYMISDGTTSDDCDFTFSPVLSGDLTITQIVTNEFGCTNTTTTLITVGGFVFYAPNSFTPDYDGINDVWLPVVIGGDHYVLEIFDRWGVKLFETNDREKAWNGSVGGGQYFAENDVYVYKARISDGHGIEHQYNGHITLVR
ncbi:MAG: PKD domain-containing protein [Flavobacteriales bacterium]|nr:PKD domain-containing protein [Flavobacteriales bacterium]